MKIIYYTDKICKFVVDLLFPIECIACGKNGVWLCKNCFKKIRINHLQHCPQCKNKNQFGQFCPQCKKEYAIDGVWVAGNYKDKALSQLIKILKYRFAEEIAKILGNFLSIFLQNLINKNRLKGIDLNTKISWQKFEKIKEAPEILFNFDNSLIIPIPLHKKRMLWRGFNQAEKIAKIVAKNFNLQMSDKLIRVKYKKPQAKLGKMQRKENIRGCFKWLGNNLNKQNIILIDDVATTCSTLNECAKILKKADAGKIYGLVVAKG